MSLAERVLRTIRRHDMLPRGGRVVIALSGGPDSVALLDLLRELERSGKLVVAGVAHFNHTLREAAEADEVFCRALGAEVGVAVEVGRADVRSVARQERRSIEDTARRLRYAFLETAADRLRAHAIAVGHSRDDQAETFLLRLMRGAGTRGLGGIRPRAGRVIRPLLDISRDELRQFAADRGLNFREDETNADLSVPRNRVRHELLPYLERAFSPGIVEVLAREAALARDDDDRLEQEAIELTGSLVLRDAPQTVLVDADALVRLHPALGSRVARRALEPLSAGRFIGFEHVTRFLEFVRTAGAGQALSLPGQRARRTAGDAAGRVLLEPEPSRGVEQVAEPFRVCLPVPGEVRTDGWAVSSEPAVASSTPSGRLNALVTGVDGALAVRFRKPGDRFDPPGMGGRTRKLQDYLVDRKVAREERDRLPLVVDEHDRIVWVVGHGVSEAHRAAAVSPGVILLKARRLGGEV